MGGRRKGKFTLERGKRGRRGGKISEGGSRDGNLP